IAVPTFENKTLLPRIEVLVTDSVIKQLQQDGTYKIAEKGNADAVLKAEITEISRTPARSVLGNVLATTEFNLSMHVKYQLEARKKSQNAVSVQVTSGWRSVTKNLGCCMSRTAIGRERRLIWSMRTGCWPGCAPPMTKLSSALPDDWGSSAMSLVIPKKRSTS